MLGAPPEIDPVWTAPHWQGFFGASAMLVGAAMCGRLPIGKGFLAPLQCWLVRPCVDGSPLARVFWRLCNAGWCGHVSDLLVRHIAPLVVMPSAYQVPTLWGGRP